MRSSMLRIGALRSAPNSAVGDQENGLLLTNNTPHSSVVPSVWLHRDAFLRHEVRQSSILFARRCSLRGPERIMLMLAFFAYSCTLSMFIMFWFSLAGALHPLLAS